MELKVSVKDGKECQKILSIEIGNTPIREEYDRFYNQVAPKAKIPGFRPGKADRKVLEMHFQKDARQEVLSHLISTSYGQVVQEKAIEALGYPEIKDIDFSDTKLSYAAHVEVRPKIKLSKWSGLKAKKETAVLDPKELEQSLKYLQESFAQHKAVEDRGVQMGDFVIADYVCTSEGKEVEKRNDDWIEIKEEEYLKGFSSQLVGVRSGEEKEVRIKFPENFSQKEYAGKEAVFAIKVKEIKTKQLPALDDDLARQVGEYKTFGELKEKISKDLLARKEREKEAAFEKTLLDEFIKHNKIDLPPRVVKKRLEYLVEQALEQSRRHGMTEEKTEEAKKKLEQELSGEASRQVHVAFLLDEIATRENFTATQEDLKIKYEDLSKQFRQPVDAIEKYYQEHEEARETLCDQIRNHKAIDYLKKNAKA